MLKKQNECLKMNFEFYLPVKLIAGEGSALRVAEFAKKSDAARVLIITGKHVSASAGFQDFIRSLKDAKLPFEVYRDTLPEPPAAFVDALADYLRKEPFDLVAAVGGGSVMDTAKAACMLKTNPGSVKEYLFGGNRTIQSQPLPLVCIPTTAGSGSEVTASSVIFDPEKKIKLSVTHPSLIPKAAILDPLLQLDMPPSVTAGTGMDALTHAIEAFTSRDASPVSDMYAKTAIRMIGRALPQVMRNPGDANSRMEMSLASTLAAAAFVNGGLGAVHGISQSMGGVAHTPHGVSNAILLPEVMSVNRKGNTEKFAQIAALLGQDTAGMDEETASLTAVDAVVRMNRTVGIPHGTSEIGVTKAMFPQIIDGTMGYRLLWMNPVSITPDVVEHILEATY
ncbi:MAG: iron-containing alcohol dehydrogenase [Oscillospiraceae bacterium]|jgi:alcohol dehydrogenase|nr:iron-containing alcohol dehydrogenase [Oscillospiraceae bacterium]MCI2036282.1 iron-containing alcohol dehydrogenase [Oscillospiraceae bacterium]